MFDLAELPKRIEVYDNSHIMGTNMVGGMVVAGPEGFEKNSYRKFNIKSDDIEPGDDYGMMREVMTRRFGRLKKEWEELNPPPAETSRGWCGGFPLPLWGGAQGRGRLSESRSSDIPNVEPPPTPAPPHKGEGVQLAGVLGRRPDAWPDLVLIDGGLGQLSAVREAVEAVGFAPGESEPCRHRQGAGSQCGAGAVLPAGARAVPAAAERSGAVLPAAAARRGAPLGDWRARAKRSAALVGQNPLDEITGVGVRRKKALLHRFGSAKGVSNATVADLQTVEGVNAALAQRIYDHFRGG